MHFAVNHATFAPCRRHIIIRLFLSIKPEAGGVGATPIHATPTTCSQHSVSFNKQAWPSTPLHGVVFGRAAQNALSPSPKRYSAFSRRACMAIASPCRRAIIRAVADRVRCADVTRPRLQMPSLSRPGFHLQACANVATRRREINVRVRHVAAIARLRAAPRGEARNSPLHSSKPCILGRAIAASSLENAEYSLRRVRSKCVS